MLNGVNFAYNVVKDSCGRDVLKAFNMEADALFKDVAHELKQKRRAARALIALRAA